jgi:hypothetical protein
MTPLMREKLTKAQDILERWANAERNALAELHDLFGGAVPKNLTRGAILNEVVTKAKEGAQASMRERILALLEERPTIGIPEIAKVVYEEDSSRAKKNLRMQLWALRKKKLLRQVDGKWEVLSKEEKK